MSGQEYSDADGEILNRDEYIRVSDRRRALRSEIADLNYKINVDKPFRVSFRTKDEWNVWLDAAVARKDRLLVEYEAVNEVFAAFHAARKAVIRRRHARLDGIGIIEILRRAVVFLRSLQPGQTGDVFQECIEEALQ